MKGGSEKKMAYEVLGLTEATEDEEQIIDAYEAVCFQARQKVLMNIGVPRLMKKPLETLARAEEAYRTLLEDGTEASLAQERSFEAMLPFDEAVELLGPPPPWTPCVRRYEELIRNAQLEVANSFSAKPLERGIHHLIHYQQAYHSILYHSFEAALKDPEHYPFCDRRIDKNVKAAQRAYSGTLLKDLESMEEAGIGTQGLSLASEALERALEQGNWKEDKAPDRVLTEAYRIQQLALLDKKKRES